MCHLSEAAQCLLFPPGRWWCHGCEAADCSDSDIPLLLPELRIDFYCARKHRETESEEKIVRLSFGSISWIFLVSAESESETIKPVTLSSRPWTRPNNEGLWICDSMTVGDKVFWPPHIRHAHYQYFSGQPCGGEIWEQTKGPAWSLPSPLSSSHFLFSLIPFTPPLFPSLVLLTISLWFHTVNSHSCVMTLTTNGAI